MARRPLFRPESEEARANAWLGRVILTRPTSFSFLAGAALAFAVALGLFFTFGEYTRKARVTGILAPAQGVVRIIAQQTGVVEAVHAVEGREVRRDAPLLVLGDSRASLGNVEAGMEVAHRLDERRAALARQREHTFATMNAEQASLRDRTRRLAREIEQVDVEMGQQRSRRQLAEEGLGRAQGLGYVGFLSQAAIDRERDATLEQEARLESLRRTRMALEREHAAATLDADMARARAQA